MKSERLISVDVFRGATIAAMIIVNTPGSWSHVYLPLLHAKWNGCTPTDLIFPFFLFIVGISISLSFNKKLGKGITKAAIIKEAAKRAVILIFLGLILNFKSDFDFAHLRYPGVLQRIGVVFFFGAIAYLYLNKKQLIITTVLILLVYWALMTLVPVPGLGESRLEPGENMAAWLDNLILKGHMWSQTKTWDPEGILSTLPAIGTCLLGILTGMFLQSQVSLDEKIKKLAIWGVVLIVIGLVWSITFPLNKSLWTSSYALYTGGWAMIFLAFFMFLVDKKGFKKYLQPFVIFGSNALTVYFLSGVFATVLMKIPAGEGSIYGYIYQSLAHFLPEKLASLTFAVLFTWLLYLIALWLYRKKIFIKV